MPNNHVRPCGSPEQMIITFGRKMIRPSEFFPLIMFVKVDRDVGTHCFRDRRSNDNGTELSDINLLIYLQIRSILSLVVDWVRHPGPLSF